MNTQAARLGTPPQHWRGVRLKYVFREKASPLKGDLPPGAISFGDVVQKEMLNEDTLGSYQEVHSGDFLVNPINLNYDLKSLRTALSTIDVRVSPAYIVLEASRDHHPRYLRWLLHQFDVAHMKTLGAGVRQTINFADIGGCEVRLPPPDEQERIANFLDEQTSRIDALIAEKRELTASLSELRQAVISEAVALPARDGWKQTRLKYLVRDIVDTEHKTVPFYDDGEYLVARTTNIKGGRLVLDGAKYTNEVGFKEWTRRAVPAPGDVLFTREAPAGEACIVPEGIPLCLGQRTVLVRLDLTKADPEFVLWSLYGGLSTRFIADLSQGSTVAHFNMPDIGNIPLFVGPLEEQRQRAQALNVKLARLDLLAEHVALHVESLREYRSSLISAAVTGDLDTDTLEVAA